MALINALTTLTNAKLIAGVTVNTYDATFELLINRASALVRQYLGQQLTRSTYTEVLSPTGRQLLILKECPIISITSIYNNNVLFVLNTDYRLDAQDKARGVVYRESGWNPLNIVSGLTMDVQASARSVTIIYIAGYYLPSDVTVAPADPHYVAGDPASLPLDISGIVDEMVAQKWMKIKTQSQGLKSYSEGGISYSWDNNQGSTMTGISDDHAVVLNAYKRWVVA